jgi:hypothetical protein
MLVKAGISQFCHSHHLSVVLFFPTPSLLVFPYVIPAQAGIHKVSKGTRERQKPLLCHSLENKRSVFAKAKCFLENKRSAFGVPKYFLENKRSIFSKRYLRGMWESTSILKKY